jgi:glycosyltransferase involved in cell wall biosynthesis
MPLFTVVIPTYNRSDLLAAALDSVAAQTFRDFDAVVADDGSTDDTAAVAGRYPFARHVRQPNAGPGAARNLGVEHATGRYVAFLDSDDLWFPWTLATFAAAAERFDGPAILIGTPRTFTEVAELVSTTAVEAVFDGYADFFATTTRTCFYGIGGTVIAREVLGGGRPFTDARVNAEDLDLLLRLGTTRGCVIVDRPDTFAYRQHPGSAVRYVARTVAGLNMVIDNERAGRYPGGADRRRERLELLTRFVRPHVLSAVRGGLRGASWTLFRRTLGWHLRLGRFRFVSAYPVLAALSATRRVRPAGP